MTVPGEEGLKVLRTWTGRPARMAGGSDLLKRTLAPKLESSTASS